MFKVNLTHYKEESHERVIDESKEFAVYDIRTIKKEYPIFKRNMGNMEETDDIKEVEVIQFLIFGEYGWHWRNSITCVPVKEDKIT